MTTRFYVIANSFHCFLVIIKRDFYVIHHTCTAKICICHYSKLYCLFNSQVILSPVSFHLYLPSLWYFLFAVYFLFVLPNRKADAPLPLKMNFLFQVIMSCEFLPYVSWNSFCSFFTMATFLVLTSSYQSWGRAVFLNSGSKSLLQSLQQRVTAHTMLSGLSPTCLCRPDHTALPACDTHRFHPSMVLGLSSLYFQDAVSRAPILAPHDIFFDIFLMWF